jgi:hypothetical protein
LSLESSSASRFKIRKYFNWYSRNTKNCWFWIVKFNERWKVFKNSMWKSKLCCTINRWRKSVLRNCCRYLEFWSYSLCNDYWLFAIWWRTLNGTIQTYLKYSYYYYLDASYTIPNYVSNTARDLIHRMLALNPADRIRTH